ncbi:hypothetical protein BDR26DRAFT_871600 [Obelidium mucronatum]|nr:hypothetical protein BDR26DRAFT_871600 [Obelidium mucronatum]
MLDGNIKVILHIIGLGLIIVQQAALFDFVQFDPTQKVFVGAYTLSQLFVFGSTLYIQNRIPFSEGSEKYLVYAIHKSRIETNFEDYDTKQGSDLLSTNRIMFAVAVLSYFQLEFLSSFSLMILGLLRSVTVLTHPLFQVYILGKQTATGELRRPWSPDELFISNDAPSLAKKEDGETVPAATAAVADEGVLKGPNGKIKKESAKKKKN